MTLQTAEFKTYLYKREIFDRTEFSLFCYLMLDKLLILYQFLGEVDMTYAVAVF